MTKLISQQDIYDFVYNKPFHIIVYYANWCKHCQNMIKKLSNDDFFHNYDLITFLEESQIEDDLTSFYPNVQIFEYGYPHQGSIQDVYDLFYY